MLIIQSARTTGKNRLAQTLETAFLVADYYHSLKKGTRLPSQPFPKLEKALQCNRICKEYINKANFGIKKGIRLVNSTLQEAEVVWTWQQLQNAAKNHAIYN